MLCLELSALLGVSDRLEGKPFTYHEVSPHELVLLRSLDGSIPLTNSWPQNVWAGAGLRIYCRSSESPNLSTRGRHSSISLPF